MNTINVTVWIIALSLPNGGLVQMPGEFTMYEQCLAALQRMSQPTARCVQSGVATVPLPADVVQKLKEHDEAAKAKAANK